jgi:hypothetical protein
MWSSSTTLSETNPVAFPRVAASLSCGFCLRGGLFALCLQQLIVVACLTVLLDTQVIHKSESIHADLVW